MTFRPFRPLGAQYSKDPRRRKTATSSGERISPTVSLTMLRRHHIVFVNVEVFKMNSAHVHLGCAKIRQQQKKKKTKQCNELQQIKTSISNYICMCRRVKKTVLTETQHAEQA